MIVRAPSCYYIRNLSFVQRFDFNVNILPMGIDIDLVRLFHIAE